MPPIPRAGFRTGLASAFPIALGYFPIAFSFGVAATRAGVTPIEATFLSLVIYAGASQFLALVLLTSGASLVISALTLMAMNLRHLLYGPALLPQAGVAVGMALVAAQELPTSGEMILILTIGSTVIFEFIGPLGTLWALRRAGAMGKRSA